MIRKGNKIYFSQNAFQVLSQFIDLEETKYRTAFQTGCKMQNNLIEHLDISKRTSKYFRLMNYSDCF